MHTSLCSLPLAKPELVTNRGYKLCRFEEQLFAVPIIVEIVASIFFSIIPIIPKYTLQNHRCHFPFYFPYNLYNPSNKSGQLTLGHLPKARSTILPSNLNPKPYTLFPLPQNPQTQTQNKKNTQNSQTLHP